MHILLGTDMKHILFCGDQLTVERARSCQDARINSDTAQEALLGLEPAIADWHAEANFLEVIMCTYIGVDQVASVFSSEWC